MWCDVLLLDAAWSKGGQYISYGGEDSNQPGKYERVGQWLAGSFRLWMPHVGLDAEGQICFTDGRHRFAWLRDHGAIAICVTVSEESAPDVERLFGTQVRSSEYSC